MTRKDYELIAAAIRDAQPIAALAPADLPILRQAPVDALAVMDRNATQATDARKALEWSDDWMQEARGQDAEARAAVAELIDKADNAARILHNAIQAKQIDAAYQPHVDELKAALARCGGAP
jgi:hypothetical protein